MGSFCVARTLHLRNMVTRKKIKPGELFQHKNCMESTHAAMNAKNHIIGHGFFSSIGSIFRVMVGKIIG